MQTVIPHRWRHKQLGINLIEIMVAMTIGLFLVLGATTLYVNSKKTADVDDSIARLQETARYAMSVIETDVRMANYWGIKKDGADFENKDSNLALPAGTNSSALGTSAASNYCGSVYATDTERYLDATNNRYTFNCTANAPGASTSADTLTVRRVSTAATPASGTRLQVCSTRRTATMTKSAATTCANGEIHNVMVNGYYIDQGSDQSSSVPSLRRKTLIDGPDFQDVEIIPGVEDMQIEFGWDNSNTDAAGVVRYLQPEDVALFNGTAPAGRIVSVRVWLLIRAETADSTYRDTRTYSYADRTGTAVSNLNTVGARTAQYAPNDNFRRLLVSRTFFVRNATGT